MMQNSPDTTRVLRIAAWMWLGYLLALTAVDWFSRGRTPRLPIGVYHWSNGVAALLFLGLAYWEWAQRRLGRAFFPLMILFISCTPIVSHHILLPQIRSGPMPGIEGIALRQWPTFLIGLSLTAWRYPLTYVFLYSVGIAALEMGILVWVTHALPRALVAFSSLIVIRTVSFIVIGGFISHLMGRLREQQESLRRANARLTHYASTLENLTISRERNRVARELHDTLAHTLTGLSVTLETAKAYWDVDPEQSRLLLDKSLSATRSGVEETRRALKALRAAPLEDLGLALALRELVETAVARTGLPINLMLPETIPTLSPDVEQCIYRVAQESLQNVTHHAHATEASVSLAANDAEVTLTIRDDGVGFDARQQIDGNHFGLRGMKERAALAGGHVHVESRPGEGTAVVLAVGC